MVYPYDRFAPEPVCNSRLIKMARLASLVLMALAILVAPAGAREQAGLTDLEKFSGVYEISPGQFVYLQPWPGGEGKLAYSDETGQLRALFFASENVFSAGPGLLVPAPTEVKITFVQDSPGKVIRLIRRQSGLPDRTAKKLDAYKREEVNFRDRTVSLTGALFSPPGKGVHPAMVLIGGTGAADRNSVLPIVHFLVTHGIALLGYDKRGVGGSPEDWRTTSLEEQAQDALAAVKFLQSRKDIDGKKIGLFGASQGGWVAPLAASQSKDIAFVISVSGPGMSPAEVELARLDHDLRARGFPENAIAEALALLALGDDVARGKASWLNFQATLDKTRETKWFQYASVPLSKDSWLFEHWRRMPLDYDPGPVIAKLHVPVLALFGDLDRTVIPDKNAEKWRTALQDGKVKDYTITIFPNANHMLLEARTGEEDEYPTLKRFAPGYAPMLLDWLRKRGIAAR